MTKIAVFCVLTAVLFGGSEARAQGYGGWRGRPPPPPGYGPPGYSGAWYGMAGCGLGSLLFGPNDTPMAQILAATTNATFGSQTFGITSGTSNCVSNGVVRAEREQEAFAEVNFTDLKRNMATGGGEFLTAFATLLGCDQAVTPALAKMTQAKYERILPSEAATPAELVAGVKAEIEADARLAAACSDARAMARVDRRNEGDHGPAAVAPSMAKSSAATRGRSTVR
jgi:hypothetical protein